jgi:ADP-heptose:LPS heptosyltransferase
MSNAPVTGQRPESLLVFVDGAHAIGDAVMKLPFLAALKQAMPTARLTLLSARAGNIYSTALKDLAEAVIDECLSLPAENMSVLDVFRAPLFPGRHFDIVIDTQRKALRALWLHCRIKHGLFISSTLNYALSGRKPDSRALPPSVVGQMMILGTLAAGRTLAPARMTLPDPKWATAAHALLPDGPLYVGFVPGASRADKRWPLSHFCTLARRIAESGAVPVFFLGPAEQEMAPEIRAAVPSAILPLGHDANVTALSGPCLTIALAERLSAAVANDSGGCHLLATARPPMVCLYRSPTVREKFLPALPRVIGLTPQDFGDGNSHAMAKIPLEAVEAALRSVLEDQFANPRPPAEAVQGS